MNKVVEEDKLHDLDIIVLSILMDYGFREGDYQVNIFPSNAKIFEKVVNFISAFNPHIDPVEKWIPITKKSLRSKNLISYYRDKELGNRQIIKVCLKGMDKYREQIQSRMRHWGYMPEPEDEQDEGNYNEEKIFDLPEYVGYEENILH